MDRKSVIKLANEVIIEYPMLKKDVRDLIDLAIDEIDEGGSPAHEWGLAYNSINELVLDHIKNENDGRV